MAQIMAHWLVDSLIAWKGEALDWSNQMNSQLKWLAFSFDQAVSSSKSLLNTDFYSSKAMDSGWTHLQLKFHSCHVRMDFSCPLWSFPPSTSFSLFVSRMKWPTAQCLHCHGLKVVKRRPKAGQWQLWNLLVLLLTTLATNQMPSPARSLNLVDCANLH